MNPKARRWAWILVLGCIGAIVFLAALPWGTSAVLGIPGGDGYAPWFIWTVACTGQVALFAIIGAPLRMRRTQLTFVTSYPPLALAALIGCGLGIGVWASPWNPISTSPSVFLPELGYLLAPATLGLLLAHLPLEELALAQISQPADCPGPGDSEWGDFNRWLAEEGPASPESQDFFDRKLLVDRIANRLSQPLGEDQSVALLGRFGSGKSSILARVKHIAGHFRQPRVWVCEVSCWGLESSVTAPAYILARLVETMDRHLDCRALSGLPAAYQRLVSAEPTGMVNRLLESIGARADWTEQLAQLSPMLRAANARLVLFVEDADRTGGGFDPQHIQRLLWALKSVRGVSFVIAMEPALADEKLLDVSKLCEYIERVPPVEPGQVRRVIRVVREQCLSAVPFVDPYADRKQKDPLDVREGGGRLEEYARRRYRNSVADALCNLLSTPRMLKHCARRVSATWLKLRGEVDLDDLIVASALREGAPEVFQFLLKHIDAVRTREKDRTVLGEKDPLEKQWEVVRNQTEASEAVQRLVDFLALEALCPVNQVVRPQGIQNEEPSDYFRRLRDEFVSTDQITDQAVLGDIDAWKDGSSRAMTEGLLAASGEESRYARVWEHFSDRYSHNDLRRITDEVLERIGRRDGCRSSGKHPALLALWRQCHERLHRDDSTSRWVQGVILSAMPISLGFTTELYYFWASARYGSIDEAARVSIRQASVRAARELYADAAKLGAVLDPERPWDVRHLMAPVDQEEPASVQTEPAEWTWLSQPILDLAASAGSSVGPTVAHLIGDFEQQHGFSHDEGLRVTESYRLSRERVDAIFGAQRADLLTYLVALPDSPWFLEAARSQAGEWLSELEGGASRGREVE